MTLPRPSVDRPGSRAVFHVFGGGACVARTRERFLGLGQVPTMPISSASNAIYPVSPMPSGLRILSRLNHLTYEVDALRALMPRDGLGNMTRLRLCHPGHGVRGSRRAGRAAPPPHGE
jgi:hypothetical protein